MYWVIGFITVLGIITGIFSIIKGDKKIGITQLLLTLIFPIIIVLYCLKKESFVFGGTDWDFLIQTAFVDRLIEPWIMLILFIVLLILMFINLLKFINTKKNSK